MILVAVDDLLFSSKIRTTAKQAGVEIQFARTPTEILDQSRALKPSLVIFDLDSAKVQPLTAIVAMKSDADLASIPTLGFVSHVHAGLIEGARRAGVDQVLARSAFAGRLAEILIGAGATS